MEWISVKDRLPDESGKYLVFSRYVSGNLKIDSFHIRNYSDNLSKVDEYDFDEKEDNRPGWYDYDSECGFYEVGGITHWQPLPEPPKFKEDK